MKCTRLSRPMEWPKAGSSGRRTHTGRIVESGDYRLDRDENGKTSLFRRVKPQIDEEPDRGGPRAVLADDVLRFSVQAWDPKDREWRDEWDSGSPQRTGGALIPPRVRIAITVKDEQGRERTWSTQSRLQLATPLDF